MLFLADEGCDFAAFALFVKRATTYGRWRMLPAGPKTPK
jgi:hypothetical protein